MVRRVSRQAHGGAVAVFRWMVHPGRAATNFSKEVEGVEGIRRPLSIDFFDEPGHVLAEGYLI